VIQQPQKIHQGTPDFLRASLALFLAGYASFSLLYCVQPLLPIFSEVFGISAAESSLALSATSGSLALSIVLFAFLSEKWGRKKLMIFSMLGASVLNFMATLTQVWPVFLAVRALEGLALGGVPAIAMTYLSEEIETSSLGAAMGLYVAGTGLGGMVGRVASGLLADHFSWTIALQSIALTGIAAVAGFAYLLPPSRNFHPLKNFRNPFHPLKSQFKDPFLPILFMMGFLALGCFSAVYNYASFRLHAEPYNLTHSQISLIFTTYLFGVVASVFAGIYSDRWGPQKVMTSGVLVTLAGLLVCLFQNLALFMAGVILVAIGFFITHAAASSWVGKAGAQFKGYASSTYLLYYYSGLSLVGPLAGLFWDFGGWLSLTAFLFLLSIVALILSRWVHERSIKSSS
jgi:YNFM family putative membrane transporter